MARPRRPAAPPVPAHHDDSWVNTITGLGTSKDKLANASVVARRMEWVNSEVLDTLYYEDDLIRKYVDKVVDHAIRQGIDPELRPSLDDEVNADEESGTETKRRGEAIRRRLREIDAFALLAEGDKRGRLHGGAAVFIGCDGSDPSTPLDLADVGRIRRLALFERYELHPVKWYADPLASNYGQVEVWRVQPGGVPSGGAAVTQPNIHESRLLRFEGLAPTRRERQRQAGWSPSIIVAAIDALRDGQQNWRSIGLILNQAHQATFKMKGLASMIASGRDVDIQKRMGLVNMARSISRALVIDADGEEFEYHSASLSGLDALAEKNWQRIAAAFDMPLTVLMGVSPAGMNATGESDMRQWYDSVQAHRQDVLGPAFERLVQIVAAELRDPSPSEWVVSWPSLWQMSPTEEATYRKTIADTDVAYVNAGIVTAQEVADTRFGGGSFSAAAIRVDTEVRELADEANNPEAATEAYLATPAAPTSTPVPGG